MIYSQTDVFFFFFFSYETVLDNHTVNVLIHQLRSTFLNIVTHR